MCSNSSKNNVLINDIDLKNCEFQNISKEIGQPSNQQRKFTSSNLAAVLIRKEIFEAATIDNDSFLHSLEYQDLESQPLASTKKIDKSILLRSIENIMEYFDREINLSEASGKSTPDGPLNNRRTTSAVSSWSNKIGNLQISRPFNLNRSDCLDNSSNQNSKLSSSKVGQLTKMFNNKISQLMQKNSTKQLNIKSQTTVNSKTPKFRRKTLKFLTVLPSPKPSPNLRRRKLQKPTMSNPLSTKHFIDKNIFQQLSVKDRVVLYEKFIEDFSNHSKLHKISAIIKDGYVKKLCTELEARISETLPGLAKKNNKKMIFAAEDTDSYASNESTTITRSNSSNGSLNDSSTDAEGRLHVSRLAVVLKPSDKLKALPKKSKKQCKQAPSSSLKSNYPNAPNEMHAAPKRNYRAYCNRLLAKVYQKMPQQQQEEQPTEEQQHVKQLFQNWLQEKNGIVFDIVPVTETIRKSQTENFSSGKRSDPDKVLSLIQQTLNQKVNDNSIVEVELPLEEDKHTKIQSENSILNPKQINNNSSPINNSIKSESVILNALEPKRKLPRFVSSKQENSAIECQNQISEDSDYDYHKAADNCFIASTPIGKMSLKQPNHIKQLIFHADNNSVNAKEPEKKEANKFFINETNEFMSTSLSTCLSHAEYSFDDKELLKNPPNSPKNTMNIKTFSNSYPSLNHLNAEAINSSRTQSAFYKFAKVDSEGQRHLIDSFIDQGFETGSNATCSPTRSHQMSLIFNKDNSTSLTPNIIRDFDEVDEIHTDFSSVSGPSDNINTEEQEIPGSLNIATKGCKNAFLKTEENMDYTSTEDSDTEAQIKQLNQFLPLSNKNADLRAANRKCSQFWISTGLYNISTAIEFYDPHRLAILSRIFSKASIKYGEMNFGIDEQKFSFGNRTSPDELIKRIPKIPNYSQYWFSTGNILIHFPGNLMNKNKIKKFFEYIQEFLDESGTLRFGIDNYDFSNSTSKTTLQSQKQQCRERNRSKQIHHNEPMYSSDSLASEPSTCYSNSENFSETISSSSVNENNSFPKNRMDIAAKMKTIETLQNKCQLMEKNMENKTGFCNYPATRSYMHNMQKMMANIHEISRATGFSGCSTDQLSVFMDVLGSYADFSLKTCSQHTEEILNAISTQILTDL